MSCCGNKRNVPMCSSCLDQLVRSDDLLPPRHLEKLGISSEPADWLVSFEESCKRAARGLLSYKRLTERFVMLGVGPEYEPEYASEKPSGFDEAALKALKRFGLVGKVRDRLTVDLGSGDEEYGDIALKDFSRWALEFLG